MIRRGGTGRREEEKRKRGEEEKRRREPGGYSATLRAPCLGSGFMRVLSRSPRPSSPLLLFSSSPLLPLSAIVPPTLLAAIGI